MITDGLIAGAQRALDAAGATWRLVRVPGSFELPVAAKTALDAGADAVVALGVIIRGGTPHFEFVSSAATDGLTRVALDTGKPVGFGVLTLDNEVQGLARAGLAGSEEDKGFEAADAALRTALVLQGPSRQARRPEARLGGGTRGLGSCGMETLRGIVVVIHLVGFASALRRLGRRGLQPADAGHPPDEDRPGDRRPRGPHPRGAVRASTTT